MAAALLCTRCGAPLPPPISDSVTTLTCGFCGTTNLVERRSGGRTEIRRAVKRELDERFGEQRPAQPPTQNIRPPVLLGAIVFGVLFFAGFALTVALNVSKPTHVPAKPLPAPPKSPYVPPPAPPHFVMPTRPDPVIAMSLDENGDVLALKASSLTRLDGASLKEVWKVDFTFKSSAGIGIIIVPRGPRIAVVGSAEIVFVDSTDGTVTGRYIYSNSGILEHACGAGKSEVLVDVLGAGWMRFDAKTGKPGTGKESCHSREKITCPPGQTCFWNTTHYPELYCTNALHVGAERYRECETQDGTKREVLVAFDAKGKKRWMVEAPDPDDFIGVINGKVIVGDGRLLNAYQTSDGTLVWSKTGVSATVSDGKSLVIAKEGGFERLTP